MTVFACILYCRCVNFLSLKLITELQIIVCVVAADLHDINSSTDKAGDDVIL